MREYSRLWRLVLLIGGVAFLPMEVSGHVDRRALAASPLSIASDQPLSPAFDLDQHDYVVRCSGDPLQVSVTSPAGVDVSVDHASIQSGTFSQAVPLGAGQEFSIAVRFAGAVGRYYVRCLPPDFPTYTYTGTGPTSPRMFMLDGIGSYMAVFDTNGVPIWWLKRGARPFNSQVLADGTVGFYDGSTFNDQIYSLAGQPIRALTAHEPLTDLHELQLLTNGDYLIDSYVPRDHADLSAHGGPSDATVRDGEVEEVKPDGSLVWSWNSATHVTPDDTPDRWYTAELPLGPPYDLFHLNSVELHGDEMILSARHTDAVWGIDRTTGNVLWKLGGTHNPASLTVVGDPQSYPLGGNHDARILSDGTLTVHDNNTGLGLAPRAVRYQIDEQAQTATLLGSVTDSADVPSSACCGSARRLSDGSWLIAWGGTGIVGGYDASGTRMFKLDLGSIGLYRAIPVPSTTSVTDLRAGMNAQAPRPDGDVAPMARFGIDRSTVQLPGSVSFDATASDDPDGVVTAYDWDFGDGTSGSGPAVSHTYTRPGAYLVRLTVHDDAGGAATTSAMVNAVSPAPQRPTARFLAAARAESRARVAFDATGSQVAGAVITSYAWRFGDGTTASGPLVTHSFARPGTYTVRLTVTSNAGLSGALTRTIRILNRPPAAKLSVTQIKAASREFEFSARASDPDGHVISYRWSFGDGEHADRARARHTYRHPGRYHATLAVRDNSGARSTATKTLRVY
ncbi:MAG: PKD domain-containing protein [Solirubrobacteraceae bacterium]